MQYEVAYLPWSLTPGLRRESCEQSLYRLLKEQFSLSIHHTREQLELISVSERTAKRLEIIPHSPCFYLETIAYLANEQPIEYSETIFRGDRSRFLIERHYGH